jgi:hypothetical protein
VTPNDLSARPAEVLSMDFFEPSELVHQALDDLIDADELGPELEEAQWRVRAWLDDLLPVLAERTFAHAVALPEIDEGSFDAARRELAERPKSAWGLTAIVELARTRYDLPEETAVAEVIRPLPDRSPTLAKADATLQAAIARSWELPTDRAHRHFRCQLLEGGDREAQARALTAEHPEFLPIARTLVRSHGDLETRLDAFEAEWEAFEAQREKGDEEGSGDEVPAVEARVAKRRFTWVHVAFAVLIIALFVWQYYFR